MKKRTAVTGITVVLTLTLAGAVYALGTQRSITVEEGGNIFLNGTKLDPVNGKGEPVDTFVYEGTTYVPVRAISEALGKEVTWEEATGDVHITDQAEQGTESAAEYTVSALADWLGKPKDEVIQAYGLTEGENADITVTGAEEDWILREKTTLSGTEVTPCFIFYNGILIGYQFRAENYAPAGAENDFALGAFEELKNRYGEPTTYPGLPDTFAQLQTDLEGGTLQTAGKYREEWDVPLEDEAIQTLLGERGGSRAGIELNLETMPNGMANLTVRYFIIPTPQ